MTATEAMLTILDINEITESMKNENMGTEPNAQLCKLTELLTNYRELLIDCMDNTELNVGKVNGNP